jgi:hypothetical protein
MADWLTGIDEASLSVNPLSLTPSRLPRSPANERRNFPYACASPCPKGKNRGESFLFSLLLLPILHGMGGVWRAKLFRKHDCNNGKQPFIRLMRTSIDEGNDSKT